MVFGPLWIIFKKSRLGVGKPSSRPSKITKLCEGIGNLIDNIVTKFQINSRSDGAWARTKVCFCNLFAYSFSISYFWQRSVTLS